MNKRATENEYDFNETPITCELTELQPIRIVMVSSTPLEPVWNYAVSKYHYLSYNQMIGPRLKYMVFSGIQLLAAISFNQASYKVGPRDSYIGWNDEQRLMYLPLVINNNRFLILPWVNVKNLASYILSQSIKALRSDWTSHYKTSPLLIETFVDTSRYKGVCYKASNWRYLGETQGFAREGGLYTYHGNRKGIYVYPLVNNFRKIINCTERPYVRTLNHEKESRSKELVLQNHEWNPELMEQAGITTEGVIQLADILLDFHKYFRGCYTHKNQAMFGETYHLGLMSNLEWKSAEPIALRYLDINDVRGLQRFFKDSPWLFENMKDLYQLRLSSNIATPDAMLTIDPSDFPKKGKESAGVARQHCGALGKTENCQTGVFVGYTSNKGYGLIDSKLYMPEIWFNDDYENRREDCAVPDNLVFQSKIDIALELINNIKAKGYFPAKWLGCDSFFGRNGSFLDAIADDFYYFADLLSNMLVFTSNAQITPPRYNDEGKLIRKTKASIEPVLVSSIMEDETIPWVTVILGEGSKGPIIADIKCTRVFEHRKGSPGRESWLFIRKFSDGKIKYSLSNAPADTPLEILNKASLLRWPIEQCFEECKSDLGMDHYEIRSYPGWHRHMLFVFLAQLFLLEIRLMFKKNSNPNALNG
jgi:SRSO17 transposase